MGLPGRKGQSRNQLRELSVIVLVTIGCPAGTRGDVTRWLAEISAGVYVGKLSKRVRDELWQRVCDNAGPDGQVLMIVPAKNEQGYEITTHNYAWKQRDFDGIVFMQRQGDAKSSHLGTKRPWSKARARRFRK